MTEVNVKAKTGAVDPMTALKMLMKVKKDPNPKTAKPNVSKAGKEDAAAPKATASAVKV